MRHAGIDLPILVFSPVLPRQFDAVRRGELTPVLGEPEVIKQWAEVDAPWHLGIDTGMNRAGMPWQRVKELASLVDASPPEGAFTHFHSADASDNSRAVQEDRFAQAVAQLPRRPKYLHAENSPALERKSPSRWDLARPGVKRGTLISPPESRAA